jgi:hypothetical protein
MIDTLGLPKEHPLLYEYIYDTSPLSQQKFKEETGIHLRSGMNMQNYLPSENRAEALRPPRIAEMGVNWEVIYSKGICFKLNSPHSPNKTSKYSRIPTRRRMDRGRPYEAREFP